MDRVLHFVLALAVVAVLALLVSSDRKKIRIRYVIQLLVIEVLLAWFFLNSDVGLGFVKGFSEMFEKLLGFANEGTNFVFGSMNDQGLAFFFLKVLCPIVFISALIGILQHIRVLPVVIRAIGFLLSKVNGMGKLESFNAVSSLILGQSENFIAYKDILGKMSRNRMYTMAATAMSTVSMSIVGAYMTMLDPKYVVAALVLNMFSTFIVLSLINPYVVDASEENIQMSNLHEGQSFFEMLGEYILAGFKVAIIVAAMLIGFIALIAALNALFATVTGWFGYSISFQGILGYIFYPVAWVQYQRRDRGGQYAHQRRTVNQFQTKTGNHVALLFVQAFNRARNNTDGREVREGHQEDGDNAFSAWREGSGDFLQIHHRHEFVGNQFGRHDTSYLQRFTGRYAL